MPVDEEIVLTPLGEEYPSLVREQLAGDDENLSCSASLSENGYAWLVVGKQLYIWKYNSVENEVNPLSVLTLPQSGLPFTTRSICVYMQSGATFPGVIAVSPEGTVRHWTSISRHPVDTSIDLEREVVHSLQTFPESINGEGFFLLSTTTFSFYCLYLPMSNAPTPEKRQRLYKGLTVQPFYTKKAKSLTRRVTSALLGDSTDHGTRLIRAFILDNRHENTDFEVSLDEVLSSVSIVAITAKQLKHYSSNPPLHNWSCDVSKMIVNAFSSVLWNVSGSRERKDSHFRVRTFLIDGICIGKGILILAAASNDAVSTHLHFALVYFQFCGGEEQPENYDWFSILQFPTDEVYRESDALPITLMLPRKASEHSDFNSNLVTVATKRFVYLIRLPPTHSASGVESVYAAPYNDELISADCDDLYCYTFLREKGICRIRLFPRGFDVTVIDDVLSVNKCGRHVISKAIEHDAQLLNKAFISFCKTDLDAAKAILSELIDLRRTSIGSLCIDYSLTVADDIPNDERWFSSGRLTRGRSIMLGQSFLVNVQVEQKVKVLSMFILFVRHMDLDVGFGVVAPSVLTSERSTRSQLCELMEKATIALDLCNYAIKNSVPFFDAAVERVLSKRKEECRKEQLTSYDYFFQQVSCIDEIFEALLDEEKALLEECRTLSERMECIEQVGNILVICIDAIDRCRDETILNTGTDSRWTQEKQTLSVLRHHLDVVFDVLHKGLSERVTNTRLRREALVLASFILGEQTPEERLGSKIVRTFFDLKEELAGVQLAEQFEDFKTLVQLTERLTDDDRKAKINDYKRKFNSPMFYQVLHQHYLENGHLENMLDETGEYAEKYFATHSDINWIRKIKNGEYNEASHILHVAADRKNEDIIAKKHLLSFAKLAALCADEVDEDLVSTIDDDLKIIKHQEALPVDSVQKFVSYASKNEIPVLAAEEIIDINLRCGDIEGYFRALLVLKTLLTQDKYDSNDAKKMKENIWLSAVKFDEKLWKEIKAAGDPNIKDSMMYKLLNVVLNDETLSDAEKLDLLPVCNEIRQELLNISENQAFFIAIHQAEDDIRKQVPKWRTEQKQLAASSEAVYASFGYH